MVLATRIISRTAAISALGRSTMLQASRTAAVPMMHKQDIALTQRRFAHNHIKHWQAERILSVALLGALPASIILPGTMALDMVVAVALPIHNYWGMEQIITDYVHAPGANSAANVLLKLVTLGTVGGLIWFNMNDVGFGQGIRDVWTIGTDRKTSVAAK
eukprot:Clim_evm4s28 gene=Clim_evmTU4s28